MIRLRHFELFVLCLSVAFTACGGDDEQDGNAGPGGGGVPNPESDEQKSIRSELLGLDGFLDEGDLVGSWMADELALIFNDDGTMAYAYGDEDEPEATTEWTVKGALLTLTDEDEDERDEGIERYLEKETFPAAILGDELYDMVLVRTDGDGSEGDGTWLYLEADYDVIHLLRGQETDGVIVEQEWVTETLELNISDDVFEYTFCAEYAEYDGEDNEEDSESQETSGSGTIRVDEDRLYITIEEVSGDEAGMPEGWNLWDAVDYDGESMIGVERFLGHKVDDDVIVVDRWGNEKEEAEPSVRQ